MIQLPNLPYGYDALDPAVSEVTMRAHHDRHHAKYVEATNALAAEAGMSAMSLEDVIRSSAMGPDRRLFNNAAQSWNHAFFWNCMTPTSSHPVGALARAIKAAFGDLNGLRKAFVEEGVNHFGSGWVWLAAEDGRLSVLSTHDGDTLVTRDVTPLLVCDLWEHAYYLDYKHDRAAFLGTWWDRLANWDFAQLQFAAHQGHGAAWRYPVEVDTYVPPIRDHCAFERALEEAGILLDDAFEPGSAHDVRFGALLGRIADYEPSAPAVGEMSRVAGDLDRRIRGAARDVAVRHPSEDHHWSPMVGGDLRPHAEVPPPHA